MFSGGFGNKFANGPAEDLQGGVTTIGEELAKSAPIVHKREEPELKDLESAVVKSLVRAKEERAKAVGRNDGDREKLSNYGADITSNIVSTSASGIFDNDDYVRTPQEIFGGSSLRPPTVDEWVNVPEDYDVWSKSTDKSYMDINVIRDLVKKQYPEADLNAKVRFLDPGKYTQFALRENPGREHEAVTSNGFYSPIKDTAYLEKDPNKLNTLRAAIHELVHDMSDDGVNDDGNQKKYMLNEGYADYIAKKIMTQELNIPEQTVDRTIGYPDEMRQVERLVALNGRKQVDEAFLVRHSMDGLKRDEVSCGETCSNRLTSGL